MALYDCGAGSTLIISNTEGGFVAVYHINGYGSALGPYSVFNIPCKGMIDTGVLSTTVNFKVVPLASPLVDYSQPFSFLSGLLVALCFAIISIKRW